MSTTQRYLRPNISGNGLRKLTRTFIRISLKTFTLSIANTTVILTEIQNCCQSHYKDPILVLVPVESTHQVTSDTEEHCVKCALTITTFDLTPAWNVQEWSLLSFSCVVVVFAFVAVFLLVLWGDSRRTEDNRTVADVVISFQLQNCNWILPSYFWYLLSTGACSVAQSIDLYGKICDVC